MQRQIGLLFLALLVLTMVFLPENTLSADATSKSPAYIYPLIKGYGGVLAPRNAAEQPREGSKVVFDIKKSESDDKVIQALDRVALNVNLFSAAGANPDKIKFVVVLHGDATQACLKDEAYVRHTKAAKNPNLELISRLREAGIEIYVCLQALGYKGYRTDEVAGDITIAAAASTVNINRQMEGYAYLPFH
jgi:intracellular sulfur oxidation DsrE/DsrF family protein